MFKTNFLDIWGDYDYEFMDLSTIGQDYAFRYGSWRDHDNSSTLKTAIEKCHLNIEFTYEGSALPNCQRSKFSERFQMNENE